MVLETNSEKKEHFQRNKSYQVCVWPSCMYNFENCCENPQKCKRISCFTCLSLLSDCTKSALIFIYCSSCYIQTSLCNLSRCFCDLKWEEVRVTGEMSPA